MPKIGRKVGKFMEHKKSKKRDGGGLYIAICCCKMCIRDSNTPVYCCIAFEGALSLNKSPIVHNPAIPTRANIILVNIEPEPPKIALTKSKPKNPMLPQFTAPIMTSVSARLSKKSIPLPPFTIDFAGKLIISRHDER